MSVFTNFAALDDLVQVIYQDINRFVIISNVSDTEWTVHLGKSDEGRWWVGRWTEAEVTKIVGTNVSDILLESFSEKLADSIIKGELRVNDPDTEDITLLIGTSSKKPMSMALETLSLHDAATYTTRVLIDIALHAQKRKCQLYPSAEPIVDIPVVKTTYKPSATSTYTSKSAGASSATDEPPRKRKDAPPEKTASSNKPASNSKAPQKLKGASLANPNKKARKYQALEFGSDDE